MSEDKPLGPPWTILKLLRWTTDFFKQKGIDSPRLDAELLLAHVLDVDRIHLYTQYDRPLIDEELSAFRALVKRRSRREPCAYILGNREFWSLELAVDPRVLIPRPDTEVLVETVLKLLDTDSAGHLVDIGTGSGAIAIAVASERPLLQVAATDTSEDALDLARKNASTHQLEERISFFEGDLLDALPDTWRPLDFVVSNPPYVEERDRDDIQPEVRDFEPANALFAGEDGLDVIRRLIPQARLSLRPGGYLLFEIGHRQAEAVRDLLATQDFEDIEVITDYGDRDRVAVARKPAASSA